MNSDKFRDAVFMVSQGLRPEESQDIAYLYELPERFHHRRPLEILMQLEFQQYIHQGKPESLAMVMDRIKRADLASKVKKMIKKNTKKPHHRTEESICRNELKNDDHLLQCEIALAKMQMQHTVHRINILQEHLKHGAMTGPAKETFSDFKMSIEYCQKASLCLSSIEKRIKTNEAGDSLSDCTTNSSSCNSSIEDISSSTTTRLDTKEQTTEVRIRAGSIPLIGLAKPLVGKSISCLTVHSTATQKEPPTSEPQNDDTCTCTDDDSGFSDAKQFLKREDKNEKEDEIIYEEIGHISSLHIKPQSFVETCDQNYMKLNQSEVSLSNEYMTTRRSTYHNTKVPNNERSGLLNVTYAKGHSSPELHKLLMVERKT